MKQEEFTNKTFRHTALKQLLIDLKHQYQSKYFDLDKSIHHCLETVKNKNNYMILTDKYNGYENQPSVQKQNSMFQSLQQELSVIALAINKCPSIWVELLEKDQISSECSEITLNRVPALTKVYRKIVKRIQKQFHKQENIENHINFEQDYMSNQNLNLFAQLLFVISDRLCRNYRISSLYIQGKMQQIQSKIQKQKLMNTYFLFAILKQQTMNIQNQIENNMIRSMFKNSPTAPDQMFPQYLLNNYNRLLLVHDRNQVPKIFTPDQQNQYYESLSMKWLEYIKKAEKTLNFIRLVTKKGEQAYLLLDPQSADTLNKKKAQLIVNFVGQKRIQIINTKITQQKWYTYGKSQPAEFLKMYLKENAKGGNMNIQTSSKVIIGEAVQLDIFTKIRDPLAQCLVNINNYSTASEFFVDLSRKSSLLNNSMAIMSQTPILSYFVLAGSLSYSFYQAFNNQATNNPQKFKKLGKKAALTLGSAGYQAAGVMIGQALIPIPFLGAFVGGAIGLAGVKGAQQLSDFMDRSQFKSVIKHLKANIKAEAFWQDSPKLLRKIGISQKYFDKTNPFKGQSKNQWITAISFCIVSLYQSQRYAQFTKMKLKKAQKKNKTVQPGTEQIYQNEFSIVQIADYLSAQKLNLMQNIVYLQRLVQHLLF